MGLRNMSELSTVWQVLGRYQVPVSTEVLAAFFALFSLGVPGGCHYIEVKCGIFTSYSIASLSV